MMQYGTSIMICSSPPPRLRGGLIDLNGISVILRRRVCVGLDVCQAENCGQTNVFNVVEKGQSDIRYKPTREALKAPNHDHQRQNTTNKQTN
jgi:hypothetical protein